MISAFFTASLFLIVVAMVLAPLTPAVMELYRKKDAQPLRIPEDKNMNRSAGSELDYAGGMLAAQPVYLGPGSKFKRIQASSITTVGKDGSSAVECRAVIPETQNWPQEASKRWRVEGSIRIPDSKIVKGHVVARKISIGSGSQVLGSIKSSEDIEIGSQSYIAGSAIAGNRLSIGQHCFIHGPVLAEEEIVIGAGAQLGTEQAPTTVTAPRIRIEPGARVHGLLWASKSGKVEELHDSKHRKAS